MLIIILTQVTFTTTLRNCKNWELSPLELRSILNQSRWKEWENFLYVYMERSPSQTVKWKQTPAQNRIVCIRTLKDGKIMLCSHMYLYLQKRQAGENCAWVFVCTHSETETKRTQTGRMGTGEERRGWQARFLLHTLFILIPFWTC